MLVLIKGCQRIYRVARTRGIGHTLRSAFRLIAGTVRLMRPNSWRQRRKSFDRSRQFDQRYGVDTAGVQSLYEFDIVSANLTDGVRYEPIDPDDFQSLISHVGDVTGYTFIDFGCGKGRALFLAAEFPFSQIHGVEFAPELVRKARENIRTYRNPQQLCHHLEVFEGDASTFPLPAGPLVLFLYNPFGKRVMSEVVNNVQQSLLKSPRPLHVLYHTCAERELWSSIQGIEEVPTIVDCACFRYRPAEK